MPSIAAVLSLVAAPALAAPGEEPPRGARRSYRLAEAPAAWTAALETAGAALGDLQRRLSARLLEALAKGGPAQAVAVCRDEAQALTGATAREHGLRLGRTSHRLRNQGNVAPAWAEPFVAAAAGRTASAAEAVAVDLGDRVGLLRPIPTAAQCTQCHGPAEDLAPVVRGFLGEAYPDDRAVGFAEGDLRGWFWVEARKDAAAAPAAPASPETSEPARGATLLGEANPRCTVCHALRGEGNPKGVPLDGVGRRLSREEIKAWIRTPAEMAKKRGSTRKPAMVAYPEFTEEELDALAAYLASLEPRGQPE